MLFAAQLCEAFVGLALFVEGLLESPGDVTQAQLLGERADGHRSPPFSNVQPAGRRRSHQASRTAGSPFASIISSPSRTQSFHRFARFPLGLAAELLENLLQPAGMSLGLFEMRHETRP